MNRISLSQIFSQGLRGIMGAQSQVYKTQGQLSSGQRVTTPADDPVAAVQILQLDQTQSNIDQYKKNIDGATSSLQLEDGQLGAVTALLTRVRELTIQAGNGALTKSDRQAIATELSSRIEELAGLANTRSANGEYIFSGFQGQQQPFVQSGNGYTYMGDAGQRSVQVSSNTYVPVSDSGKDIFVAVPSSRLPTAVVANGGNATIAMGQVVNQAIFNSSFATPYSSTITLTGHVPVAGNQVVINGVTFTFADAGAGNPDSTTVVDATHVTVSTDLTTGPTDASTGAALVSAFAVAKADPAIVASGTLASLTASGTSMVTLTDSIAGPAATVGRSVSFAQGAGVTNFGGTPPTLVLDAIASTSNTYNISVDMTAVPPTYQVDTVPASTTPVATGNFVSGQPIQFNGVQVDIVGTPGIGAVFSVSAPSTQDTFTTLSKLTQGLQVLGDDSGDRQRLADLISESLDNLDSAQAQISTVRAKIGARLNILQSSGDLQNGLGLVNQQILSQVRDLDYASAISQLTQENVVLQAAQQSFAKVSSLSLFDFLR